MVYAGDLKSPGRNPMVKTLLLVACLSLENAITATFAANAAGAIAVTELENTGPRIKEAPSPMAKVTASAAPAGVPMVSWGSNSNSLSAK